MQPATLIRKALSKAPGPSGIIVEMRKAASELTRQLAKAVLLSGVPDL